MKRERSAAYPVLDLATAYRLLCQSLRGLGTAELERSEMAKALGYQGAIGGLAARKIGGLVHFGLLDRRGGRYGLSPLALRLQKLSSRDSEFPSALRAALEHPTLFKAILERYRNSERLPPSLDKDLASFSITERASADVEEVFRKSALFAGVIDTDGLFLKRQKSIETPPPEIQPIERTVSNAPGGVKWHRIPFMLANKRQAILKVPEDMTTEDFVALGKVLFSNYEALPDHLGFKRPEPVAQSEASELKVAQRPVSLHEVRERKR
jgi:hypothetical protein